MSLIITPQEFKEVRHPQRRTGYDEMQARGLCDIQDPDAKLPSHCSRCGVLSTSDRPLRMEPVDPNPKSLAKAYLYKALCVKGCHDTSDPSVPLRWGGRRL